MHHRPFLYATIALILISIYGLMLKPEHARLRWAAYYDNALPPSAFQGLDLAVFDRERHPDLTPLKGKTLLFAYLSIGEVHSDTALYAQAKSLKLLIKKNKAWKSDVVDITSPAWSDILLEQAKDAFNQGFDGLMLDTIDSPLHYAESLDTPHRQAVEAAAINLIHEIHKHYPQMKLILNRGFSILPRAGGEIDYILAESIYTKTDVSTGQSTLFPPKTYGEVARQLRGITAEFPRLQVLTLDYWNPQDVNGLESIYRTQAAQGFHPYVATPDLHTLVPIPEITALTKK